MAQSPVLKAVKGRLIWHHAKYCANEIWEVTTVVVDEKMLFSREDSKGYQRVCPRNDSGATLLLNGAIPCVGRLELPFGAHCRVTK